MSRRIDYRTTAQFTADEVAAAMLDADCLRARLKNLGGPGAALLEHKADAAGGRYRLRQGVDAAHLPSLVRTLVAGNLVIERTETLTRSAANSWVGTVDVAIPSTPASAVGTIAVTGAPEVTLRITADVTVSVPFVGGRIEAVIVDQVTRLLKEETAFTLEWLKR